MNNKISQCFLFLIYVIIITTFSSSCKQEIKSEINDINADNTEASNEDTISPAQVYNVESSTGDSFVLLSWINPSDTDFKKVEITFSPIEENISQPIYVVGEASKTSSVKIENLKNDIEYSFSLSSMDKSNNKSESITIKATPKVPEDKTPPSPITNLSASAGNGSVLLSWTNPLDTDFQEVEITFSPSEDNITQPIYVEGKSGQISSFNIEDLVNDTEYNFSLSSMDKSNNKTESITVRATPKVPEDTTPPSSITNLSASAGNGSVLLSWINPDDDDFCAVQISFTPTVESISQPIFISGISGQTSSVYIEHLLNGVEYNFSIIAIDTSNNKSQLISISAIPIEPVDNIPPSEVSHLSAVAKHKKIILSWTNPSEEDFSTVEINYISENHVHSNSIIVPGSACEQKSFTIDNLENGITYIFTIKTMDSNNNKSQGTIITSSPVESTIQLAVSVPNDGNVITLTKDTAPIDISIISTDSITKVVWKKNLNNSIVSAEELLADSFANQLSNSNSSRFYVSENAKYDIAVQNEEGICVLQQIEVKTIDKIPLDDVNNLSVECDGNRFTINWDNPVTESSYDSPLNNIRISYAYNDNQDNETSVLLSNVNNYSINVPSGMTGDDYIKIKVQTVDKVGNISNGVVASELCCFVIRGSSYFVAEKIKTMTKSGNVIINGTCDCNTINDACIELRKTAVGKNVRIDLDLSNVVDLVISNYSFQNNTSLKSVLFPDTLQELGSSVFSGCTNLERVEIPYIYNVYGIQSSCFRGCTSLNSVIIGNVRSIGEAAFYGCTSLSEIEISDYVERIDCRAFCRCENLEEVYIGGYVRTINSEAFLHCDNLNVVTFKITSKRWYKNNVRVSESTKKGELNGTSIGYAFTNPQQNGQLLAETYSSFSLYREDYEPLLKPASY